MQSHPSTPGQEPGSIADTVFDTTSKDILAGFFEDRPDELAEAIVQNWPRYIQQKIDRENEIVDQRRQDKLKAALIISKQRQKQLQLSWFARWRNQVLQEKLRMLENQVKDEKRRVDEIAANNMHVQIEARELRDKALRLENELEKEQELKKKKKAAAAKRKKMKNQREASKSLSMEKAGKSSYSRSVNPDDPYMTNHPRGVKVADLEKFVSSKATPRATFGLDQRGSINTQAVQRRKHLTNSKKGRSVATASVMSHGFSEFSFHPEINRDSKWVPKYDDHHDHERMWARMHNEHRKILAKRRLMSQEKEREELLSIYNSQPKKIHMAHSSQEVNAVSERMYAYADKHKNKLANKKKTIEQERGQEINFTPKLVTTKGLEINRTKGEVYDDLYNDYVARKDRKIEKVQQINVSGIYSVHRKVLLNVLKPA